jgi:N-acetylglucosamine-6-phosphate deacetylase
VEWFKKARENQDGPELLGLHLEGPYFSMEQRGAQDPRFIKNPDREEYMKILDYSGDIIRWTVAPELEGALEMGRELKSRGVLPSIGHSNAIYEDVQRAFENGFTHVTHLYSGMSMVRRINAYRYAGVVESAFLIDDMTVEIIADGKHLPQSLLKLIYKIKGPDRICLVTDSMRAAGMPDGEYILGSLRTDQKVVVEDGVAKLPDRSAFAGSVATADRLVKTKDKYQDSHNKGNRQV